MSPSPSHFLPGRPNGDIHLVGIGLLPGWVETVISILLDNADIISYGNSLSAEAPSIFTILNLDVLCKCS